MKELEYVDKNEVLCDGVFVGTLNYKPIGSYVLLTAMGIGLIALRSTTSLIIGIVMIGFVAVTFFMVKDKKLMDLYSDALLIYDPNDQSRVMKLDYEKLECWSVDMANRNIVFTLKNETTMTISCPSYLKAFELLSKAVPDKKERSKIEKLRSK